MKELNTQNNNNILDTFLKNEFKTDVLKNYEIFGSYFESNSFKDIINNHSSVSELNELWPILKVFYKLKLEINYLYNFLEKVKKENHNIDLLKLINNEIFIKRVEYDNTLNELFNIMTNLTFKFWWDLQLENNDIYSKLSFVLSGLRLLRFDIDNFDFILNSEDFTINFKLKQKIIDIKTEILENKESLVEEIMEDFRVPLVRIDLSDGTVNAEIINSLKYGWYKKNITPNMQKLEVNSENDGLFLINLNILYKYNKNGHRIPDQVVFSQYRYNKIFLAPLVGFIDQVHTINAKFSKLNSTIFVIDKEFEGISRWNKKAYDNLLFKENLENIYRNSKTTLNSAEFILAISLFGPVHINTKDMFHLVDSLFKGENIKVLTFYLENLKILHNDVYELIINKRCHVKPPKYCNNNLISKFMFLVKDKDSFIQNFSDLKINGGPRTLRHEGNSLQNRLSRVDDAFRKSFARSLSPHFSVLGLKYNDFSADNFHKNLGYFRFYSTGRSKNTHPFANITLNPFGLKRPEYIGVLSPKKYNLIKLYSTDNCFHDNFIITHGGKSSWLLYSSKENYDEISASVLESELNNFFRCYMEEFENEYFAIIFKIKLANGDVRSCSTVQIAHIKEFSKLYASLASIFSKENLWDVVSEPDVDSNFSIISGLPIGNLLFSFKPLKNIHKTKYEIKNIKNRDLEKVEPTKVYKSKSNEDYIKDFNYKGYRIPATMDLFKWPNIVFMNDYLNASASVEMKSGNSVLNVLFFIEIKDYSYHVTVMLNNNVIMTIKDVSLTNNKDLSHFKRTVIENNKYKIYIFKDSKIVFYTHNVDTTYIKPIKKDAVNLDKRKILTLDLETRMSNIKGVTTKHGVKDRWSLSPVCMSIYDGKKALNFAFNFKTWEKEMIEALKTIMVRKYDGYKVYTHNFSYFDSIFMLDVLSRMGTIKPPIMRNNKILKLTLKYKVNDSREYTLYFMDSYLMLPSSLDNLSKSFNIDHKKYPFPHDIWTNSNLTLEYKGKFPDYKYFNSGKNEDRFTHADYIEYANQFKNKDWCLKEELLKYCENDTVALYEVLTTFQEKIYKLFLIDVTKYSTIPSLTFAIFRSNYLNNKKIPNLLSKLHYTIKQSYYGGITEIYKPKGEYIRSYDINSLYPSSMRKFFIPTGNVKYFSGEISNLQLAGYKLKTQSEILPFGFIKVVVNAPNNLNAPILPVRIKTAYGVRTVFPLGKWEGWYFSEEIKNAMKCGYTFEVKEGYIFEKDDLFSKYIDILYKMKSETEKTDPLYYIAKLLMNALYGRFGLNPVEEKVLIVSEPEADEIIQKEKNVDVIPLRGGKVIVSYSIDEEDIKITNISVSVASAIAAYSRIEMSHYLIKYKDKILYIDTDGIKISCDLDPCEVDNKKIGKMKFENLAEEFIALAPKVYGVLIKKEDSNDQNKKEMVKIKGYSSKLPFHELKKGLNKNHKITLKQDKWFRKIEESTIIISEEDYTLNITESKRKVIYDSDGNFIDTKPLVINTIDPVSKNGK